MKLQDVLKEYGSKWPTYSGTWGVKNYRAPVKNVDPVSADVDPQIEQQLIDQIIDVMYRDYPEIVKDNKIKRHLLQMVVGKVTAGEIQTVVNIDNVIKRLKKRMKVKTS